MSALRSIGLPAALLAATGGVALAAWRYLSAKRAEAAEPGGNPVEGGVEEVSAKYGEEAASSVIGEKHIGARQVCRAGETETPSPLQTAGGSTGSDRRSPAGASPGWQEKKSVIQEEKRSAAAAVTSVIEADERNPAAAVTPIIPEEKSAVAAVTSVIEKEKRIPAAAVTPVIPEEKKGAAAAVTSVIPEEKSTATAVTSVIPEEKSTAAAVTSVIPEEEKSAAAAVTPVILEEEKGAAAAVTSITSQENSTNPNSVTPQEDASVLQHKSHNVVSSASQEQCNTTSVQTKQEVPPKPPRLHGDPSIEKELSYTISAAHVQPKEKHAQCTQVLVLGLDGSGKTSIMNSISANKGKPITTPTEGVNAMCIGNGSSKMEFLEIGGSEQLRPYWKMYLTRAFAVIFVVDSADHGRLPLAKRHLHQLIQQDSVLPLIVLANKQDLQNAHHIPEIHDALALSEICENRKLFLIGTYVTKDGSEISSGIQDTKEFLAQLLLENSVKTK